jgi:glutaredoxin
MTDENSEQESNNDSEQNKKRRTVPNLIVTGYVDLTNEEIMSMYEKGLLTDEEFAAMKKKLLKNMKNK